MGLTLHLKVWRQKSASDSGRFVDYTVQGISEHASFLEMLDVLNIQLVAKGEEPVAFDHDCREGICGSCAMMINGCAHGEQKGTTACQLHLRHFEDGQTVVIEPWRARAFPIIKDLVVDRSAFDRIMAAGGYVSTSVGNAPEANSILVPQQDAEKAMDAAACIGCGACVASCKNASAMLFVSAKVSQYAHLPQGGPERAKRVKAMVAQMDQEGFGACSNTGACEAACPKGIQLENIALLNRELARAQVK
ncbi:MAG: succinate dehydrogenase/fumarate reductase iron-sulfur subunit [Oligoflexia bacterium]